MSIGNEENMKKIQDLMKQAQEVNLGNKKQGVVEINFVSEDGNEYKGIVVFKRPSIGDYMKMGGLKSEYLRQAGVQDVRLVDNSIKYMANVLATLKVVIVKCPSWLMEPENVVEPEVLYHVYDQFEKWVDSFRKTSDTENTGDSKTSGPA